MQCQGHNLAENYYPNQNRTACWVGGVYIPGLSIFSLEGEGDVDLAAGDIYR